MVVSPSAYLLAWMERRGWQLPERRFVQHTPSAARWSAARPTRRARAARALAAARGAGHAGGPRSRLRPPARSLLRPARPSASSSGRPRPTRLRRAEVVFFGRLETRKGLELFCDALDLWRRVPSRRTSASASWAARPDPGGPRAATTQASAPGPGRGMFASSPAATSRRRWPTSGSRDGSRHAVPGGQLAEHGARGARTRHSVHHQPGRRHPRAHPSARPGAGDLRAHRCPSPASGPGRRAGIRRGPERGAAGRGHPPRGDGWRGGAAALCRRPRGHPAGAVRVARARGGSVRQPAAPSRRTPRSTLGVGLPRRRATSRSARARTALVRAPGASGDRAGGGPSGGTGRRRGRPPPRCRLARGGRPEGELDRAAVARPAATGCSCAIPHRPLFPRCSPRWWPRRGSAKRRS